MSVKLVAVTMPRIPEVKTAEEFVAYAARVSNPGNQNNSGTATKLLKYLARNKHWSPFEMVQVVMEIETTRDIGRQILRHRSFSFQEFSQRYADPTTLGFVTREARLQDALNRQNSIATDDKSLKNAWEELQLELICTVRKMYMWADTNKIAKEQSRAILPEGLMLTKMYMSGTLRSWIHFCELRMGNGTQKEHQKIAKQAWELIIEEFPSLEEVLYENSSYNT